MYMQAPLCAILSEASIAQDAEWLTCSAAALADGLCGMAMKLITKALALITTCSMTHHVDARPSNAAMCSCYSNFSTTAICMEIIPKQLKSRTRGPQGRHKQANGASLSGWTGQAAECDQDFKGRARAS